MEIQSSSSWLSPRCWLTQRQKGTHNSPRQQMVWKSSKGGHLCQNGKSPSTPHLTEGTVYDTIHQPLTMQSWQPSPSSFTAVHALTCDPNEHMFAEWYNDPQVTSVTLKVWTTSQINWRTCLSFIPTDNKSQQQGIIAKPRSSLAWLQNIATLIFIWCFVF